MWCFRAEQKLMWNVVPGKTTFRARQILKVLEGVKRNPRSTNVTASQVDALFQRDPLDIHPELQLTPHSHLSEFWTL